MGKKKGYDISETDAIQADDNLNSGRITFTQADYDALLTPSIYPELTGQEMNPVEEIPVAVKPNPNKTIDENQQNNEDSKQTDANSTEVIQIVIPEDPVHTNIDQQHDELIEDKAQKINQENLMATKPVDNKDSSNSPSNKSDGNVHQETTVYASLLQPSTNGNKAKQFEDTKQEEKKESPAKANSPANDTVLITDEKYISIDLGERKDSPKKSKIPGFLNKLRSIPRERYFVGIIVLLLIIIIILIAVQPKKHSDDDDDGYIARSPKRADFEPANDDTATDEPNYEYENPLDSTDKMSESSSITPVSIKTSESSTNLHNSEAGSFTKDSTLEETTTLVVDYGDDDTNTTVSSTSDELLINTSSTQSTVTLDSDDVDTNRTVSSSTTTSRQSTPILDDVSDHTENSTLSTLESTISGVTNLLDGDEGSGDTRSSTLLEIKSTTDVTDEEDYYE